MNQVQKHLFAIIALWVMQCFTFGQQSKIDSLRLMVKTAKEDTNKANRLTELAYALRHSNPDSTILLSKNAISLIHSLSSQQQSLWTGEGNAYGNIGIGYRIKGDYAKAKENYFEALKIDEKNGDKLGIAKRYIGIGNVYNDQADYPRALEYYFKALKIDEELKNKRAIAICNGSIGFIYQQQANYLNALEYQLKAADTFEEIGDKNNLSETLGEIGIIYKEQSNYTLALSYLFRALKLEKAGGFKQLEATTISNIGNVYKVQGEYDKALGSYATALQINETLNRKNGIATDLGNIGSIYIFQKKYAEAEKYLLRAVNMDKEIGALKDEMVAETNLNLLYEKTGQLQLALEHYKKATDLKDTIFNQANTQKIMNYGFEKKETEAKAEQDKKDFVADQEKQKQKIILYAVCSGLFLMLALAGFIYWGYRQKQKANILILYQKKEVEKQKEIIEEKNKIVEEKQKEILDSIRYARRIQSALLPQEKYIDKNLDRLQKKN